MATAIAEYRRDMARSSGGGARDDHSTIDAAFEAADICKARFQALAAALNSQSAAAEILGAADMMDDVIHDYLRPARFNLKESDRG